MNEENDDERVLLMTVIFRGTEDIQMIPYRNLDTLTIGDVKRVLVKEYNIDSSCTVWLVFKGMKLQDEQLLIQIHFQDYDKIYMGVERANVTIPVSPEFSNEFELSNASTISSSSPFADLISSNPEMILELLQMNPKMKALMERNPQIKHALSDPKTLQSLLQTGSDPRAYKELMRGHDRALSNIENLPGGFQMLRQFYTKELAELEEGVGSLKVESATYDGKQTLTTDPMPNPWNKRSFTGKNLKFNNERDIDFRSYEIRFSKELEMMKEMGFTDTEANIKALIATDGNVTSAIDYILNKL